LILVAATIAACGTASNPPATAIPVARPTHTPLPADTGWRSVRPGLETRELSVENDLWGERLFVARVDPQQAAFRVRYDPAQPRRVGEWLAAEDARLVVNAGFFDDDNRVLGLLIADGEASGATYVDLGGLFGVRQGRVQVRSLILQPYRRGEVFDQMVQSFPTLLTGGGAINTAIRDDGAVAPRTVVGVDRQGRVVFLVSPRPTFNLTELAAWLAQSDLDLDAALNLDGGTSSGLVVQTVEGVWGSDSWARVPAVIVVE
jgi:uncharacterized protein YigE (DUF2233 family)